jgi:molecular chaperone GrpE
MTTADETISATQKTTTSYEPATPTSEMETTVILDSTEPTDATAVTLSSESTTVPTKDDMAAATIQELTRQLAEMTQKAENHWATVLRKQAEYDNLQKRTSRDLENSRKFALEKFASELLAVKDSMELGLNAAAKPETPLDVIREGMSLTLKMLADMMNKFGIVEINPLAEKFNPQWHEAIAMQPLPNVEDGQVIHVHQKGYQLSERLLRPARVIVAKAIATPKPQEVAPATVIESQPLEPTEKSLENQG